MSSDDDVKRLFPRLGEKNYNQWVGNFIALAMKKNLYSILSETETKPKDALATALPGDRSDFDRRREQLAGELFLSLEDDQKTHVVGLLEDPVAMWKVLKAKHIQERPATRFNAYSALLSIRKDDDDTLPMLITRVDKAMQEVKQLAPEKFTIEELYKDLASMALIQGVARV